MIDDSECKCNPMFIRGERPMPCFSKNCHHRISEEERQNPENTMKKEFGLWENLLITFSIVGGLIAISLG
ncbi:MAG: hypothetical protein GY870_04535 [archaeon]|nr:hypothetical protein [archaeon]